MSFEEHLRGRVLLAHGDSRDVLRGMADCSVDSVITDPPYALVSIVKRFGGANAAPAVGNEAYTRASSGFMNRNWDTGETAFAVEFWAEVMRVLKPGGHVIAASGTRTYHRLAVAIEDAGFEIRDMLSWLYGSGFPKSHDVSKAIDKAAGHWRGRAGDDDIASQVAKGTEYERTDKGEPITPEAIQWAGYGTALKPACEPWVLARKPLIGTVAANVLEHGTGALNIDACRIHADDAQGGSYTVKRLKPGATLDKTGGNWRPEDADAELFHGEMKAGRFPANVIHDGSAEVLEAFPAAPGQLRADGPQHGAKDSVNCYGDYGPRGDALPRLDSGSAARFFYSAKADADDRIGTKHPTVKPVSLMEHFITLVTPPGGVVLDPFAGSGTTGEAAYRQGFNCILIEREEDYCADIRERLRLATRGAGSRKRAIAAKKAKAPAAEVFGQVGLGL